ncbi:heme peroxidase [Mycena vulgaris]|nr:heme peroxidase [Mycena vulgaris]
MLKFMLLTHRVIANTYVWPSPQLDALEALRFDQQGHNAALIAPFLEPCDAYVSGTSTGQSNAADWIRTAYHDMAPHNVADGTGGLDASSRFQEEQDRAENPGDGFANTAVFFIPEGPEMAYRGGRIDAGESNIPGVPEPQQDPAGAHLILCAPGIDADGDDQPHRMWSLVKRAAFPDTVPELNDSSNTLNVVLRLHRRTTQNPLVMGLNDITNSDKRIFASDGNATGRSKFLHRRARTSSRMVDTVHGGQLTKVITPLSVKQSGGAVVLNSTGSTLKLNDEVRKMQIAPYACSGMTASAATTTAASYAFKSTTDDISLLSLDAAAGITNMRFAVDGKLEDQGGFGFAVQGDISLPETSCSRRFDVAVRTGLNPARVYLEKAVLDSPHTFLY